jgi:hypothetical protein
MKETLEEAAENYGWRIKTNSFSDRVKANELAESSKQDFIQGAKWQAERMYSEEDMRKAFIAGGNSCIEEDDVYGSLYDAYMKNWFEQFKKK